MTNKNDALPVVAELLADAVWIKHPDTYVAAEANRIVGALLADRDAELAELRLERDNYRAVLEGAEYSHLDNLKAADTGFCRDVGVAAKGCYLAIQAERDQLQAELAALREAAKTVLAGLNERIDYAVELRQATPVFEGIAALHAALNAAPLVSDKAGAVDERAAFEAEITKGGWPHADSVDRDASGEYRIPRVKNKWEGWQARAALNPLAADVAQGGEVTRDE